MSWSMVIEIPGLPKSANARMHWIVRHKENKKWKDQVALLCFAIEKKKLERAKLILTRFSSQAPDSDNIVAGFKPVIDGLVECGILANDKFVNIGMPDYRWEKCKPSEGKIRVEVMEVTNDE